MTRLAISVGILLILGSCSGPTLLSGEGVACSTSSNANPYRKCDLNEADYVCINTYKVQQTPVWVCRVACNDIRDCSNAGDVCCQAPIYGNNLGKTAACVPKTDCDAPSIIVSLPGGPMSMITDGGAVDARMSLRDAATTLPGPNDAATDAAPMTTDTAPDMRPHDAGSDVSADADSDGPAI
jgi:hypothetical protein